jgi:hypothetical protein
MLHLIVGNKIVSNLYSTLIVTVDCILGLNNKSKFSQKLEDPICLCTCLNDTMILYFYSRQGDYLLFLTRLHQRSNAKMKHIARGGLPFITVTSPVRFGEVD